MIKYCARIYDEQGRRAVIKGKGGLTINKCHSNNADCILQSSRHLGPAFIEGIPKFSIRPLDPLYFKKVDASITNLLMTMKNVTMTGAKTCKIINIEFNLKDSKLSLETQCKVDLTGSYKMKGKLLFLPIEGHGDLKTKIGEMLYHVDMDMYKTTGKDGKKHWRIKGWKYTFKSSCDTSVYFGDLFGGNKVLSEAIERLIASSPNEIVEEVGSSVVNAYSDILVKNIDQLFKHVPVEDLSLDHTISIC